MRPYTAQQNGSRAALILTLLWAGLMALTAAGVFAPLDTQLRDQRFWAGSRVATGKTVFVDIDSGSLGQVGTWPWPRSIYAMALDRLMALGAGDVVFDIDFSMPSNPASDAAFAAALDRAGGFAMLAAFRQEAPNHTIVDNLPIAAFRTVADPVAVNVPLDADGQVRRYPLGLRIGGGEIPSVASQLAGLRSSDATEIAIDYSIDPASIPRVPISAVLSGAVPADAIAGRNVIIGASAVELRDLFVVPRYGAIPGALVQVLAAETLLQGRALVPAGLLPPTVIVALLGIVALLVRRRLALRVVISGAVASALLVELAALLLQLRFAILVDTVPILTALLLLTFAAIAAELAKRAEQRRLAEMTVHHLSRHDPITDALNMPALMGEIAALQHRGKSVALVLVAIRRFRAVNDTLGHEQGDALLRLVHARLLQQAPLVAARLAAGTFALVLPRQPDEELCGLAEAWIKALCQPYELAGQYEVTIAASVGIAAAPVPQVDPFRLLSYADMALSAAKQRTGSAVVLYEPAMSQRLEQRQALDVALHAAVRDKRFRVVFQPQVSLQQGGVIGAEALVRWTDDTLGEISPADFVPVAEETGQIVELGRQILQMACAEAVSWPRHLRLAVNVSPVQFELSDVVADIRAALAQSGLEPSRLDVEITEGVFVNDAPAMIQTLEAVRALGVGVALDDFGTGYSSLAYLGRLPIDKIKLDQSFVRRLLDDRETRAIVETVLQLSRAMGKPVVAEGISDEPRAQLLRALGAEYGQGFHFARPLTPEDFLGFAAQPERTVA